MIEARRPHPFRPLTGRLFDRELTAEAVYTSLAVILDQIDFTNQACSPAEPIGGLLDPHLIAKASKALRDFREARAGETPRLKIPE